jgi:hypothetical protein
MMTGILIATNVIILAAAGFVVWNWRRAHAEILAGRDATIERLTGENRDLLNRLFASKGQPPVGTDMQAFHGEREAERKDRRQRATREGQVDPLSQAQAQLERAERSRMATTRS